jgi:outer membrane protein
MMSRFSLCFATCLSLILISGSSIAQTPWSLQSCIDHAFTHNLQIKQSHLGTQSAEIGMQGAQGAFLPSLNASASHGYNIGMTIDPFTNDFATDAIQSNNFGLSSGLTLYNGFKNHINLRRARIGLDIAATSLEQTRNDLALTISGAYLNILFQEEFVKVAILNLETTRRQVERVAKLVEAGASPASDLLDVQAQEASDIAALVISENGRFLAKLNLAQLLQLTGQSVTSFDIVAPEAGELTVSPIPLTSSTAVEFALTSFPQIRAASLNVDDANLGLEIAKTSYLPRLYASYNFGSGYSGNRTQNVGDPTLEMLELGETEDGTTVYYAGVDDNMNLVIPQVNTYDRETTPFIDQLSENINQSVFFSLSVPIFNNYSTKNSIELAKVSVLRSEYNQQAASQILRTSIESAWADAVAAQKTLAAQEAALNAAELAFVNTELKFEAGTISALEYADARTRLDNARIGALRTRYDLVFKSKILDFYQGKSISL